MKSYTSPSPTQPYSAVLSENSLLKPRVASDANKLKYLAAVVSSFRTLNHAFRSRNVCNSNHFIQNHWRDDIEQSYTYAQIVNYPGFLVVHNQSKKTKVFDELWATEEKCSENKNLGAGWRRANYCAITRTWCTNRSPIVRAVSIVWHAGAYVTVSASAPVAAVVTTCADTTGFEPGPVRWNSARATPVAATHPTFDQRHGMVKIGPISAYAPRLEMSCMRNGSFAVIASRTAVCAATAAGHRSGAFCPTRREVTDTTPATLPI